MVHLSTPTPTPESRLLGVLLDIQLLIALRKLRAVESRNHGIMGSTSTERDPRFRDSEIPLRSHARFASKRIVATIAASRSPGYAKCQRRAKCSESRRDLSRCRGVGIKRTVRLNFPTRSPSKISRASSECPTSCICVSEGEVRVYRFALGAEKKS